MTGSAQFTSARVVVGGVGADEGVVRDVGGVVGGLEGVVALVHTEEGPFGGDADLAALAEIGAFPTFPDLGQEARRLHAGDRLPPHLEREVIATLRERRRESLERGLVEEARGLHQRIGPGAGVDAARSPVTSALERLAVEHDAHLHDVPVLDEVDAPVGRVVGDDEAGALGRARIGHLVGRRLPPRRQGEEVSDLVVEAGFGGRGARLVGSFVAGVVTAACTRGERHEQEEAETVAHRAIVGTGSNVDAIMTDAPTEPDHAATGRSLAQSVALGVGIGLGLALIVFFLIAIPFYTLASFEPNGIDRPIVRTGLFRIALPVGVVLGVVIGAASGWWLRRGGSWTVNDGGDRYSNR